MGVMRADLVHALHAAGFADVDVRTVLSPAWTTDWISEDGRRKLAAAGIAPPGPAPVRTRRAGAAVARADPAHGGLPAVRLAGHRGALASSAPPPARRCAAAATCREPFEHVKEI